MSNLPHVHNLIFGEPWAITPEYHGTIAQIYATKIADLNTPERIDAALAAVGGQAAKKDPNAKPYDVVGDVAVLALNGPLVPKGSLFTQVSGLTSMASFSAAFRAAMADELVNSIIIAVDSPGGTVQGMLETAQTIRDARSGGTKPIMSLIDGLGASAAYVIACQANETWCTIGATVGSIGVIATVQSDDRAMKNQGIDSVVVRSKELKAPGTGALTPNQMTAIQKRVMDLDAMVEETVGLGRPKMDLKAVANGDIWTGKHALAAGLVDGITTLPRLINSLS